MITDNFHYIAVLIKSFTLYIMQMQLNILSKAHIRNMTITAYLFYHIRAVLYPRSLFVDKQDGKIRLGTAFLDRGK